MTTEEEARAGQKRADEERERQTADYAARREREHREYWEQQNREAAERQQEAQRQFREQIDRSVAIDKAMAAFFSTAGELQRTVRRSFADARQQYKNLLQTIIDGEAPDSVTLVCLAAALGKKDEATVCTDLENALAEHLDREQSEGTFRVNHVEQLRTRRGMAVQRAKEEEAERPMKVYAELQALDDLPPDRLSEIVSPGTPKGPPVQYLDGRGIRLGQLNGEEVVVGVGKLG